MAMIETTTARTGDLVERRKELIARLKKGWDYIDELKRVGQDASAAETRWLDLLARYCTVEQELMDRGHSFTEGTSA